MVLAGKRRGQQCFLPPLLRLRCRNPTWCLWWGILASLSRLPSLIEWDSASDTPGCEYWDPFLPLAHVKGEDSTFVRAKWRWSGLLPPLTTNATESKGGFLEKWVFAPNSVAQVQIFLPGRKDKELHHFAWENTLYFEQNMNSLSRGIVEKNGDLVESSYGEVGRLNDRATRSLIKANNFSK